MKNFSKTHITFLLAFLLLGLAGGYFWYWSVHNLEVKNRAKANLLSKMVQVEKKGLPPTVAVLSKMKENEKAFQELSQKSLEEVRASVGLFDTVVLKQEPGKLPQGLSSDVWKKMMNEKRDFLDKLAANNKLEVPKDFYYGFQKYRISNPEERYTGHLGIQLLGLSELSTILLEAKVRKYNSAKRVFIEEGGKVPGQPGASAQITDESLAASVLNGPDNLYQIYPFEVAFRCSTQELRDVINRVNLSPYFFVIRFLNIENEKANVKSKSVIQTEVAAEATRKGSLMVPVAGNEYLQVRMRVDMLVWAKQNFETEKAPEARGSAR